jgi:nucleotide-binding universal stress UspA family protein
MLERLFAQAGRTAKSGGSPTGGPRVNDQAGELDMLPTDDQTHDGACDHVTVLVALSGTPVDREAMTLACNVVKNKRSHTHYRVELSAVYGISVPRTLAVDAEMPEQVEEAQRTLIAAEEVAESMKLDVQAEYIQARAIGQSVVQLAGDGACALIIVGVPYEVDCDGQFVLSEVADYVLKHATCRVWIVRGNPTEVATKPAERAKEPAVTR